MPDLSTILGPVPLSSVLIAASGTVGSVVDFAAVGHLDAYGAAVAKSVSREPWEGRAVPRINGVGAGMLNGIGIQNPGVAAWSQQFGSRIGAAPTKVFGSAVGGTVDEFADVAGDLEAVGVEAIEVNLSCPNLNGGTMFALDEVAAAAVIKAVRARVSIPIGAKLSPNAIDVAAIAGVVADVGAEWVVLTNTVSGAGIDVRTRRPLLSGIVGGYSGPPLKPIAMRCVIEVRKAHPDLPIVGCGGVASGEDVVEYLMAGAQAVAIGSAHFANPRIGRRILAEVDRFCRQNGVNNVSELIGAMRPW